MAVAASLLSSCWTATSLWTTIPIILLAVWAFYRVKYHRYIQLGNKLPGPMTLPFIGNAHEALQSNSHSFFFDEFRRRSAEYDGIARFWFGPRLIIGVWNPEDVEIILSSNTHLKKTSDYKFFEPWLGDGLLISSGTKWRNHRKLIAPTFHLSVLKTFISVFNANSKATVERMRKEIGKEFDAHDYMVETTVEILLETAMGVNKKTQESAYDYGQAVMKMCDIMHFRHLRLWFRSDFLFSFTKYAEMQTVLLDTIHSLTRKVIAEKRKERRTGRKSVVIKEEIPNTDIDTGIETVNKDETVSFGKNIKIKDDLDEDLGEKKRKPFLDQLMDMSQDGVVFTDTEIKEQVDTIMFEGHDTTAAAASFFLCVMGNHPDVQERCAEELRGIFGDSDRSVTFQDTLEMKYLERCILETIRMYPPVPFIARDLEEDCKMASGDYIIPAGATVVVATYILHHSEKSYPNHDTFNPDNFLPEKAASRHYYSFVPFSAGPRSCVGRKYAMLKLKILLSTILRNYKITSDIPDDQFRLQADIILKRADGFKIKIEPRKPMVAKT